MIILALIFTVFQLPAQEKLLAHLQRGSGLKLQKELSYKDLTRTGKSTLYMQDGQVISELDLLDTRRSHCTLRFRIRNIHPSEEFRIIAKDKRLCFLEDPQKREDIETTLTIAEVIDHAPIETISCYKLEEGQVSLEEFKEITGDYFSFISKDECQIN